MTLRALAPVPLTVPELPDVVSARTEVAAEVRSCLLGFMASGTVSLSSVKSKAKNKIATHGQGGVGKTTMAVMLVNDPMVQRGFERIAWVSVGQTPNITELLRSLYEQLTGSPMNARDDATNQTMLEDLQGGARASGGSWCWTTCGIARTSGS